MLEQRLHRVFEPRLTLGIARKSLVVDPAAEAYPSAAVEHDHRGRAADADCFGDQAAFVAEDGNAHAAFFGHAKHIGEGFAGVAGDAGHPHLLGGIAIEQTVHPLLVAAYARASATPEDEYGSGAISPELVEG